MSDTFSFDSGAGESAVCEAASYPDGVRIAAAPEWFCRFYDSLTSLEVFSEKTGDIIAATGRSREHVCRMFKKYTGTTINTYLNDLRLEHACAMLTTTYSDIADIAAESGFDSISTFYHLFRKAKGMTPAKYRRLYSFT